MTEPVSKPARAAIRDQWIDTLAEISAAMAGYVLKDIPVAWEGGSPSDAERRARFVDKAIKALAVLAPAPAEQEPAAPDIVPDDVRNRQDVHILQALREWRGLTESQLAAQSGLSPDLIGAVEQRALVPNEMHDAALAMALNVSASALTDWAQVAADDLEVEAPGDGFSLGTQSLSFAGSGQATLTRDDKARILEGETPIAVWREKRGLSVHDLAQMVAILPSVLGRIEAGFDQPDDSVLLRLAAALNIDVADLQAGQDDGDRFWKPADVTDPTPLVDPDNHL